MDRGQMEYLHFLIILNKVPNGKISACQSGEMVDALALGASEATHEGPSPSSDTIKQHENQYR